MFIIITSRSVNRCSFHVSCRCLELPPIHTEICNALQSCGKKKLRFKATIRNHVFGRGQLANKETNHHTENQVCFQQQLLQRYQFVVRKMDGESESKRVIPAHKFVLSISSPVFEAMFYGELAKTKDSIELPDCAYESLLELPRYMYRNAATKV